MPEIFYMKQRVRKLVLFAVTMAAWMSVSLAGESDNIWNLDELRRTPKTFAAEKYPEFQVPGIRSLLYESVPFRGKPAKVFAYYSAPAGPVPAGGWPAVVLVHGGGGTAYYYYVKIWNSWGYAAISMDLYGKLPLLKDSAMKYVGVPGRPNVEDGWPADKVSATAVQNETRHYHAVAQTILAHSLIRSFPEINPEKIGIVGTSWGGVHASIAAAIDGRFKFAAIIYSSVFETAGSRMQWWDSGRFVPSIKIPTLWVKGTGDVNFSSRNWQHAINICGGGPVSSLVVGLGHGDNGQIYAINRRFADSIIKGTPLPKVGKFESSGKHVKVAVDSASSILKAELCYTCDAGPDVKQTWKTLPAAVDGKQVSAELPDGVTFYFINVYDEPAVAGKPEWPSSSEYVSNNRTKI